MPTKKKEKGYSIKKHGHARMIDHTIMPRRTNATAYWYESLTSCLENSLMDVPRMAIGDVDEVPA